VVDLHALYRDLAALAARVAVANKDPLSQSAPGSAAASIAPRLRSGASGVSGQGNKGGDRSPSTAFAGAGGGGANAAGGNTTGASGENGGLGGAGIESSITGTAVFYAGGGGGSRHFSSWGEERKKKYVPPEVLQIQEEIKATKALKKEILPDLKSGKLDALAKQRQQSVLAVLNAQIIELEKRKQRAIAFHRVMQVASEKDAARKEELRQKKRRMRMVMALLMN
jgi:hypothetical protein